MATILNDVTSISSGMSQNQWVKCFCQVVEIVTVCPINFCIYNDITKPKGVLYGRSHPFSGSVAKLFFISKQIWCKEDLKTYIVY